MIIAIDGPAASGKGTLARRLAGHLGYAYLDSGALYRAVGLQVLNAGEDPGDEAAAIRAAANLQQDLLDDPAIRGETPGKAASRVAVIPGVRQHLLAFQQNFAALPPDGAPGAVIDGRDIGTIVCPDADLKIFVTASAETRAKRRTAELLARGETADLAKTLADITARDARDRSRKTAPLKRAEDAYLLDTTNLDIDGVFLEALALVESAKAGRE